MFIVVALETLKFQESMSMLFSLYVKITMDIMHLSYWKCDAAYDVFNYMFELSFLKM